MSMVKRALNMDPGELSSRPLLLTTKLTLGKVVSSLGLILKANNGREFRKLPRFSLANK